jgi:hypothetical protein
MGEDSDNNNSGSEKSEHSSEENLQDAVDMYETQFDRIDHNHERLIDRGDRYFRRYLYSTSILVGSLSLGPITIPDSLCIGLWMGSVALLFNGICLKKYRDFIKPRNFVRPKYELDNDDSMLSKKVLRKSRNQFLGSVVKRFDENLGDYTEMVHGDGGLDDELKDLHQWIFVAIIVNILLVLTLVVI